MTDMLSIKIFVTVLFLVFGYGVLLTIKEAYRCGGYRVIAYVFESLVLMPFSYAVYCRLRKDDAMRRGDNDSEVERYGVRYKISIAAGCAAYLSLAGVLSLWAITG